MKLSKILIPLLITSCVLSAGEGRVKDQKEINVEYIEKGKKQLSKEDLFKIKQEISKEVPKESSEDYVNIPKEKPIELFKAIESDYHIEKDGFIYSLKDKTKNPIRVIFSSTGISNPIKDHSLNEIVYRIIKKKEIRLILTDDKMEEISQITIDEKRNILQRIDKTLINGKEVFKTECSIVSKERNNTPEKVKPIYNSKPYQLKCSDGSYITEKFDLNLGDKEFEASLDFYTRIRNSNETIIQKTNLKVNAESKVYDLTYYEKNKKSIISVK